MNQALSSGLAAQVKFYRAGTLAACGLLMVLYAFSGFGGFQNQEINLTIAAVQIVPLLLFLPALLKNRLRSYQWLCFMILLYFIQAVLDAFTPDSRLQGITAGILSSLLFCCALLYVNKRRKLAAASPVPDQSKA